MISKFTVGLTTLGTNCLLLASSIATFVFTLSIAKCEYDGVNHCSVSNGCERNCFCCCSVNFDSGIFAIVGSSLDSILCTVNLNICCCSILITRYVDYNLSYVFRNCEGESTNNLTCTKLDTRVTFSIVCGAKDLRHACEGESVIFICIRLRRAKIVTVNVRCATVSTKLEYDLWNNYIFILTTFGASTANIVMTCSFDYFCAYSFATIITYNSFRTCLCTSCIYSCSGSASVTASCVNFSIPVERNGLIFDISRCASIATYIGVSCVNSEITAGT